MTQALRVSTRISKHASVDDETLRAKCMDCDWKIVDFLAHERAYQEGEVHVWGTGHTVVINEYKD